MYKYSKTGICSLANSRWRVLLVAVLVFSQCTSENQVKAPAAVPYDEREVRFTNEAAGATLAGTLTLPSEGAPFPVVILISGGGAHDRNYTLFGHRHFSVISDYLTRKGLAVLRFDDRGVGQSTGDRTRATSEDFAFDVLAGIEHLKSIKEIDSQRMGLIGHSEGGTIAGLAAASSTDIAFVVLLASPGLHGREYNLQYEESMGRAMGLNEETINRKRSLQESVLDLLLRETEPVRAEKEIRRVYAEFDAEIPDAALAAAIKRFLSPWFLFSLRHDPADTLRQIRCPVLALFGQHDAHVPPERNTDAVELALQSREDSDDQVVVLPRLNHFFQESETGSPVEYDQIEESFSVFALDLMAAWILEHTDIS